MPDFTITSPIELAPDGESSVRVNITNISIPVDVRNIPLPVDVQNIPTVEVRNFPRRRGFIINSSVSGAPGLQQPQVIFTAPQDSAIDVIVRSIRQSGPNDPAFIMQVGPFLFYTGGNLDVTPSGDRLQSFHIPVLLVSGEQITVQTGNPGTLSFYIQLVEH